MGRQLRNEMSGEVHGPVVQAGRLSGGVHFHLPVDAGRQVELDRAQRRVADGEHLAGSFTRIVAFLHAALLRAQEETVRLTWERDHRADDGRRRGASAERARAAERRTARQLGRATAARSTALRLALVARAELRRVAPEAHDVAAPPPKPPVDTDLDPDGVDRWLDLTTRALERLAEALGEPFPAPGEPFSAPGGPFSAPDERPDRPPTARPGGLLEPLVDALTTVPLLATTANRALVVQLLGHRSGVALSVPESSHLRVHVTSIVLACLGQADGIADLLAVLELLEPHTLPLAEVRRVVDRLR